MMMRKAMAMAAKVGVAPRAPRVAARQRHRANAPAPTAKEYYRINVATPFLSHLVVQRVIRGVFLTFSGY